jgi:L-ascorbate metabolism protein UlaG (beta-lactamase superfamily)
VRLFVALFLLLLVPYWTHAAPDAPPRALPVDPSTLTNSATDDAAATAAAPAPLPLAVPGGINIHWYGHGFVLITSSFGVRAAIDPFGSGTVQYPFPPHLIADFVLITDEAEDHASVQDSAGRPLIFGHPLIFRSVTAVGLNRANGIEFHGVSLQHDPNADQGANTAFLLTFDGISMCYLGNMSAPLLPTEQDQLGHVDVVFLPVGLEGLTVAQFDQVAAQLDAKVIIPINYKTDRSGGLQLRTLDEYLRGTHLPVRRFDTDEIALTPAALPAQPTVYALKSP